MEGFVIIALKSIAVYVFIVAAIRLFGKKEFAQLSVVDLVFILLISNAVQNAMVGADTSLSGGLFAAFALFLTNFAFKKLELVFPGLSKVVEGEPIVLVYQGKLIKGGLVKSSLSEEQLNAAIREHGIPKIEEVDLAVFEVDGNISVLSENYQKISKRKRKGHKVLR
ncbi:MAG: YetF domain-containing protein [Bacteroidota bacterium]